MKRSAALTLALLLAGTVYQLNGQQPAGVDPRPPNAPDQKPAFAGQTRAPERKTDVTFEVVTVAQGLEKPWGFTFLPGGKILVTEKPGRLRIVSADGTLSPAVTGLPPGDARNQGGLLDVVLGPQFSQDRKIYWCYSEPRDAGMNNTAVARGTLVDGDAPRIDGAETIYQCRRRAARNSTSRSCDPG